MSDPFIGQIVMFAGDFAPRGWARCDGQLLPIHQHQDLFSLLGTTYGGDGQSTFALPDLRGRAPVHAGRGPGLPARRLGETGGGETTPAAALQSPPHSLKTPGPNLLAARLHDSSHDEEERVGQPFGVVNYIIALRGIYPSRG